MAYANVEQFKVAQLTEQCKKLFPEHNVLLKCSNAGNTLHEVFNEMVFPERGNNTWHISKNRMLEPGNPQNSIWRLKISLDSDGLNIETDSICSVPVYFACAGGGMVFSSDFNLLKSIVVISDEPDELYLSDYFVKFNTSPECTFNKHIKKLTPGKWIVLNGELRKQKNHELSKFSINENISFAEAQHEVHKRLLNYFRYFKGDSLGAELSSGIDTSGIAVYLNCFSEIKKSFFSYVSPVNYTVLADESSDIHKIEQHLGINSYRLHFEGQHFFTYIDNAIKHLGFPAQQHFEVFAQQAYAQAGEMHLSTVFSGFGGDQGISNPGYAYFTMLQQSAHWRKYFQEYVRATYLPQKQNAYWHMLLMAVYGAVKYLRSNKSRFNSAFQKYQRIINQLPLTKHAAEKLGVFEKFRNKLSTEQQTATFYKKRQYLLTNAFLYQRAEYSHALSNAHQTSISFPYLHGQISSYINRLPVQFFIDNGINRLLMREILKNKLPEYIVNKTEKYHTAIPGVHYLFQNDFAEITAFIKLCRSKKILDEYIDYEKMLQWAYRINNTRNSHNNVLQPYFITYISLLRYFYLKQY